MSRLRQGESARSAPLGKRDRLTRAPDGATITGDASVDLGWSACGDPAAASCHARPLSVGWPAGWKVSASGRQLWVGPAEAEFGGAFVDTFPGRCVLVGDCWFSASDAGLVERHGFGGRVEVGVWVGVVRRDHPDREFETMLVLRTASVWVRVEELGTYVEGEGDAVTSLVAGRGLSVSQTRRGGVEGDEQAAVRAGECPAVGGQLVEDGGDLVGGEGDGGLFWWWLAEPWVEVAEVGVGLGWVP